MTEEIHQKNQSENNILKDYGCFLGEYNQKICPIFYIKFDLWKNILMLRGKECHRSFKTMSDDDYILRIPECELANLPVFKNDAQKMLDMGVSSDNINIKDFVKIYNKQFNHITEEYMENLLKMINFELDSIDTDVIYSNLLKNPEMLDDGSEFSLSDSDDS